MAGGLNPPKSPFAKGGFRGIFGIPPLRPPHGLVGRRAPHSKVAAHRHRAAGDTYLGLYTSDLPSASPSLQLLDAVGVHPKTATAAPDVAAAGEYRARPLDADIRLVKVQGFSVLDPAEAKTFQVELVEQ